MMLEEMLREAIAREVAKVTPGPDPYRRLVSRRRRRHWIRGAAAAVLVAALAAAAPVLIPAGRSEPVHSELMVRLLRSPPRGGVAADAGYAAALADAVAESNRDDEEARDLDRTAVLFVDDAGDARIGIVASYSDRRVAFGYFVAPRGADPAVLAHGAVSAHSGPNLRPFPMFVADAYVPYAEHLRVDAAVGVAPDGCRVATATDPALARFAPAPTLSYVVSGGAATGEWWQVTCDGVVRYEGPPGADQAWSAPSVTDGDVATAVAGARGTVDPDSARAAVEFLLSTEPAAGGPRVLWGGDTPLGGVTVAAVPVEGGAWRVHTFMRVTTPGRYPMTPAARVADPDAFLALRLPGDGADARVLVLPPPGAESVAALGPGGGTARVRGGFAMLPGDGDGVTFEARNAEGRRIAVTTVPPAESSSPPANPPRIDTW
jgi:hypothetical protein